MNNPMIRATFNIHKMHRMDTRCIFWLHASVAWQLHRVDTRHIFRLYASIARQLHRVDTRRIFRLHASAARQLYSVDTRRIFRLHASVARQLHSVDTRRIFRFHASVARQLHWKFAARHLIQCKQYERVLNQQQLVMIRSRMANTLVQCSHQSRHCRSFLRLLFRKR